MPPIIINPKETWNWAPFVGTYPSWQPGETITARLKVFYGTDKPSEADFTLRRQ